MAGPSPSSLKFQEPSGPKAGAMLRNLEPVVDKATLGILRRRTEILSSSNSSMDLPFTLTSPSLISIITLPSLSPFFLMIISSYSPIFSFSFSLFSWAKPVPPASRAAAIQHTKTYFFILKNFD